MESISIKPKNASKTSKRYLHPGEEDLAFSKILSFYEIPPTSDVPLYELEQYCLKRLKVLQELDSIGSLKLKGAQYRDRIERCLKDFSLSNSEQVRQDVLSHFALRLAFCKTASDRNWFINQEVTLLRSRLRETSLEKFLEENGLKYTYTPLDYQDYSELEVDLKKVLLSQDSLIETNQYFKVPFEEALDLIRERKVLLKKGFAYVPKEFMFAVLGNRFSQILSEALPRCFKFLGTLNEEYDHVIPLLHSLSTRTIASCDYVSETKTGKVDINQIDALAKRSFPLCMKSLHNTLRTNHHLKHMGRMQYGLFLKGIGVSLEDALIFWRNEFKHKMTVEKFEQGYSYHIRHNYGKEGRRQDYTPYSCVKIIMGTVGVGESHGCPFRHFDQDRLRSSLLQSGVSEQNIREVFDLVKNGNYQVACRKHFELTHPNCSSDLVINHPNQYYDQSEKYFLEHPPPNPSTSSNPKSFFEKN